MIRATTPLQEFTFDQNPEEFSRILITYTQDDEIILEKDEDDLTFSIDSSVTPAVYVASFRMTQEEANLFGEGAGMVQVRCLTSDDEALAGKKTTFKVEDVLNDVVLTV